MAYRLLGLCKMLDKRLWGFENPLRQFTILKQETLVKLEEKKATVDRLRDMTADEIGEKSSIHVYPKRVRFESQFFLNFMLFYVTYCVYLNGRPHDQTPTHGQCYQELRGTNSSNIIGYQHPANHEDGSARAPGNQARVSLERQGPWLHIRTVVDLGRGSGQ